MTLPFKDCNQRPILVHGEAGNDHFYQLLRLRSMDDPLPKTAQDHYAYKINDFHPSLDNIIVSILKRRCTPGMKKCKSDKWTNRYLSRSSSWTTLIFRGEDTLSPISCFPNNYYEYFVSISICSLLG